MYMYLSASFLNFVNLVWIKGTYFVVCISSHRCINWIQNSFVDTTVSHAICDFLKLGGIFDMCLLVMQSTVVVNLRRWQVGRQVEDWVAFCMSYTELSTPEIFTCLWQSQTKCQPPGKRIGSVNLLIQGERLLL